MTPEHAFLDSIWEELDDDATKLIFADWLEDQDDWRSSLLRWQVERNQHGFWTREFQKFQGLITERLLSRGLEWIRPLRNYSVRYSDGTGLLWARMQAKQLVELPEPRTSEGVHRWITEVTVDSGYLADVLTALESGPRVRIFLNFSRDRFANPCLRLARARGLERVRSLDLTYGNHAGKDLRTLLAAPNLCNLQYLFLGWSQGVAGEMDALSAAQHLTNLRGLDLARCGLEDAHLLELLKAPLLKGLTALYLEDNRFGERGVIALTRSHALGNLRVLNLARCGLPRSGSLVDAIHTRFPFATL